MENIIHAYTLPEAIDDGVLIPIGAVDNRPLIATRGTFNDLPIEEIRDLFVHYFGWHLLIAPMLNGEDRMFSIQASNGKVVWVIDDGSAITLLYPSEY